MRDHREKLAIMIRREPPQKDDDFFRLIVEQSADAIVVVDRSGIVRFVNRAAERLFAQAAPNMVGQLFGFPISSVEPVELEIVRFGHGQRIAEMRASEITLHGETLYTANLRDITELVRLREDLKHSEQQYRSLALYDPLTGLPNRRLFRDRLQQAIYHAERHHETVALLVLDLDNFKFINDSLGHEAGDQLLVEAAKRLSHCVRKTDTVSRLGGDEFTMVAPDIKTPQNIAILAQRLKEALKRPFTLNSHEVYITASIGIAVHPLDGQQPDILIKNADLAMYQAKERGKDNYCFYTQEMNVRSMHRLRMQQNLRRALEQNEFELYFQPKVELNTGRINGAEALIRWNAPDLGLILPGQFIPIAEETGIITLIDRWVFKEAMARMKSWQSLDLPHIRIAINLSAREFNNQEILKTITGLLENNEISPSLLEIELTESAIIQDSDKTTKILEEIRRLGLLLALDDFGTGYSSLNVLKCFPIDVIKIDYSFIKEIPSDSHNSAICRAIITMAHSLNLKVIAEGVETEEQLNFLREERCDEIQGFYFCAPLPEKEFLAFLQQYHSGLWQQPCKKLR